MTAGQANTMAGQPPGGHESPGEAKARLPRWKKILLGLAGLLVVLGLVLQATGGGEPPPAGGQIPPGALGASNLVEGGGAQAPAASQDGATSLGMTRMGFSFFAGFALGYALRAFMKLALIAFGVLVLALLGLTEAGLVTVHWEAMDAAFNAFMARIQSEAGHLQTFLTGSLPAAGLGVLGLVAGFRKS